VGAGFGRLMQGTIVGDQMFGQLQDVCGVGGSCGGGCSGGSVLGEAECGGTCR
jgi:hypothetical protein